MLQVQQRRGNNSTGSDDSPRSSHRHKKTGHSRKGTRFGILEKWITVGVIIFLLVNIYYNLVYIWTDLQKWDLNDAHNIILSMQTQQKPSKHSARYSKLQQDLLQKVQSTHDLPQEYTLESCQWIDTRSKEQNEEIQQACTDSTFFKAYRNTFARERYVCGVELKPNTTTLVNHHIACKDKNEEYPSLFRVTPTIHNADQLPPITLRYGNGKNDKGKLFPKCDVPCYDYGSFDVNTVRSVEVNDNTIWKFTFSMEGPKYYPYLMRDPDGWRNNNFYATTSFDSEIPLPYYSRAEYNIQAAPVVYEKTIHAAVFLAGNCGSNNGRESMVQDLMQTNLRVDSLGTCLRNAEPPPGVRLSDTRAHILSHYLFHLTFENQCADDYITEKLWGALEAGVIPVYYGAPNIIEHVPPNSIINVRDFPDMNALASYLKKVENDKKLYESYHTWRSEPLPEAFHAKYGFTEIHSTCRMCRWAYARMYGLGWNHTSQNLQDLHSGPRHVCLNQEGFVRQPFAEVWTDSKGSKLLPLPNAASMDSCTIGKDNKSIILHHGLKRTIYNRDGVIDLHVEPADVSDMAFDDWILQLHTPLTESHPTLVTVRNGIWRLQDTHSRYTLLAFPLEAIISVDRGKKSGSIIAKIALLPMRFRVIIEDIDTFHNGADQKANYFGEVMTESFFKPAETFVVMGK